MLENPALNSLQRMLENPAYVCGTQFEKYWYTG